MQMIDVLSLFLYFPEDKSEYFPAAITCMIFLAATILTMRWFIHHSRKEQEKAKQLEEQLKNEE
ncbi:hypothetical protein [Bacillus sp. PS06]|uniref:hypothetical protein n=1 Tax=Bacillus sp. PS06 TaxID=2764176 RepID=UPI0017810F15|nr:hypothetical protein [Bacillus sp. PS06]MBD8070499.1 hypothetical protein [Bacillus sp. PS06]